MYKFNKILVGLDQSDMDHELIDAACKMCQLSGSVEVCFMNLIRDFHMPDEVLKEFPDLLDKAVKERETAIRKAVEEQFSCPQVKVSFVIKQGQATKEIMKYSQSEKVDLIILGRKNEKESGGIIISRVARRAGCSLLVLPKGHIVDFDKILVPSDFSDYSKIAMEKAIEISEALDKKPEVTVQNVYQVPSGYHYTGKTFAEFAVVMEEHARKDFARFSSNMKVSDLNLNTVYTLDKDEDVIGYIYNEAKAQDAKLIIIGAKGRTATTALFIGSKAESLIQIDSDIPLLVVRPKGKKAGLIEYLQEL